MRRSFTKSLLICLVPTLLAAVFVGYGFKRESENKVGFRRGIDLAGGTILVYEVDQEKFGSQERRETNTEDMKQLAEKLKKRIDPADLKNVVIRPLGSTRIEIILPFAGTAGGDKSASNEEFVQEVRALVKQAGVLEFRILANMDDDGPAIRDAQKLIDDGDSKLLEDLAKFGKIPPAPDEAYKVKAAGEEADVRYQWVELGNEERESLGLSQSYEKFPATSKEGYLYHELKRQRGKTYVYRSGSGGKAFSALLYSRDFIKPPSREEEGNPDRGMQPKKVEYFMLTRASSPDLVRVTDDVRITAREDNDSDGRLGVSFRFNPEGAKVFGTMCSRNFKASDSVLRSLAIIMDDKIVSAPTLNAALRETGIISGKSFDSTSVNRLVTILRSGNLNAQLKPDPVSENSMGATLGETTIRKGLVSVALAFSAVLIFMVVYYRFAGMVACVALFVNLLLTIGFMVAVNAAFTLPGLAGLVLMLGMAVDANVLIYERLREERERGATLIAAIRNGYDRALPTIIDTHLTSIFTAVVLYTFGNDNLKGFSVSLTVGLIISLFTSLFMTRLMFDYGISKHWVKNLKMMKLFSRPNFDFMKIRKLMFSITIALTILGIGIFFARGNSVLNVDFTQGTVYGGRLMSGQERGLSKTSDGKLGLIDLLGESRQKTRLVVDSVVAEEGDPNLEQKISAGNIYTIKFNDGETAVVTLANKPDGATLTEQLANLKDRVSRLPDSSVETVFQKGDEGLSGGKTRSFTIRTTEKEKELVQVMLDRLLRDENDEKKTLLNKTTILTPIDAALVKGPSVVVELDTPSLPSYLKSFIERELKLAYKFPEVGGTEAVVVTGIRSENPDIAKDEERTQRFRKMSIDFSKNIKFRLGREGVKLDDDEGKKDVASIVSILNHAKKSFEARPVPERLETFDPSLAKDTQDKAAMAVLLSWLAVLAYLWFRFGSWQFGLAAVLCLIHDLCFTLGMIAICHYIHDTTIGSVLLIQDFKIDLTAVAALLTLVGYSVNDTIVVFDRIREVRGKSPALTYQMINDSVNQTLSRTVLASLTVFLVVGVLYIFGGEGVHLFAFVMVIGVIVGTYSSIYIASPLLLLFGEGKSHTPASALVAGDKESPEANDSGETPALTTGGSTSSTSASATAD